CYAYCPSGNASHMKRLLGDWNMAGKHIHFFLLLALCSFMRFCGTASGEDPTAVRVLSPEEAARAAHEYWESLPQQTDPELLDTFIEKFPDAEEAPVAFSL